jgi:hypothetical protein
MSTQIQRDVSLFEVEVGENSCSSSKRTKTSLACDYFDKFVDAKGLPKIKCKNYDKVYIARDDGGSLNMKRDVKKCVERGGHIFLSTIGSRKV